MATFRPGSRLDPRVEHAIRDGAVAGLTPAQIRKQLEGERRFRGLVPEAHTIQRAWRFYRIEDQSPAWRVPDAQPDEAALVLDTLAAVLAETGERPRIGVELAGWIVRVRRARPDLVPAAQPDGTPAAGWASRAMTAFGFARRYLWHETRGVSTEQLDLELATCGKVGRVRVTPHSIPPGATVAGIGGQAPRRRRDLEQRLAATFPPETGQGPDAEQEADRG